MTTTQAWKAAIFKVSDKLSLQATQPRNDYRQMLLQNLTHILNRFKSHRLKPPVEDVSKMSEPQLQDVYVATLMRYCNKVDDKDTFDFLIRSIEAHPLLEEGDRVLIMSLLFGRPPATFRSLWSRINPYVDGLTISENIMIVNTFLSIVYKYKKGIVINEALTFVRNYIQEYVLNMPGRNSLEKTKLFYEYTKCLFEFTKLVPATDTEQTLFMFVDVGRSTKSLPWLDKIDPATWVERAGRSSASRSQYVIDPRTRYLLNKLSYTYAPLEDPLDEAVLEAFRLKTSTDKSRSDLILKRICEQMTYTYSFMTTAENIDAFSIPKTPLFKIRFKFPVGVTLMPMTLKDDKKVFLIPPGYIYNIVKSSDSIVDVQASGKRKPLPALVDFIN